MSAVDSRTIWGPKVWRLLHLLAAISDRRDVALLWHSVIRTTAEVLPCATCRTHMQQYLASHSFMRVKRVELKTGADIRHLAMSEVWLLHNNVNERLGKPTYTLEELVAAFNTPRDTQLQEARDLYDELKLVWEKQIFKTINAGHLTNWLKAMNLLIALLRGGPS